MVYGWKGRFWTSHLKAGASRLKTTYGGLNFLKAGASRLNTVYDGFNVFKAGASRRKSPQKCGSSRRQNPVCCSLKKKHILHTLDVSNSWFNSGLKLRGFRVISAALRWKRIGNFHACNYMLTEITSYLKFFFVSYGAYSQLSVAVFTASRSYLEAQRCFAKGSKKDDVSSFLKIMVRLWGGDQVSNSKIFNFSFVPQNLVWWKLLHPHTILSGFENAFYVFSLIRFLHDYQG